MRKASLVTDPAFGKIEPCKCTLDARLERQWREAMEASGVAKALYGKTFDTFDRGVQPVAFDKALAFAREPAGFLVYWGNVGGGKTHLLTAIANELARTGYKPFYWTADDLIAWLQEGYGEGDHREKLERARDCDVLMIDDLGAENLSDDKLRIWFSIVNHRYNAVLPTVIATNLRPGDLPPRIDSRLNDTSIVAGVVMRPGDYRRRKRA